MVAFIIGAVFNILSSNFDFSVLTNYVLQAIVGGIFFLLFKILGDVLRPFWLKHLRKIIDYLNRNDESR